MTNFGAVAQRLGDNKASSEAAAGPGISNKARNTERRKDAYAPGGCRAATGGLNTINHPVQRTQPGVVEVERSIEYFGCISMLLAGELYHRRFPMNCKGRQDWCTPPRKYCRYRL